MLEMLTYISYMLCAPALFLLVFLFDEGPPLLVKILFGILGVIFIPPMLLGYVLANIADRLQHKEE